MAKSIEGPRYIAPPLAIPGNQAPAEYAAHIRYMADAHPSFGWSWHMRKAADLLTHFAPDTKDWHAKFGPSVFGDVGMPSAVGLVSHMEAYWRPLHEIPLDACTVEIKYTSGMVRHEAQTPERDGGYWEHKHAMAWRPVEQGAATPAKTLPPVMALAPAPAPTGRVKLAAPAPLTAPPAASPAPAATRARLKPAAASAAAPRGLLDMGED